MCEAEGPDLTPGQYSESHEEGVRSTVRGRVGFWSGVREADRELARGVGSSRFLAE